MDEFIFNRELLSPLNRKVGISAFLRVRNGDEFLCQTIESHIDHFDEIVAVYNQCTDRTPEILYRLSQEYPQKIKVYEYKPRVFPISSTEHQRTPPDSINSIVNYYNYALSKTTYNIVTKLDDDHFAIKKNLTKIVDNIRKIGIYDHILMFSGINLMRSESGEVGVYSNQPFAGNGDHFYCPISNDTYFKHHSNYEIFTYGNLKSKYVGLLYFHLKYLKKNHGFDNYELESNPKSRHVERLKNIKNNRPILSLEDFRSARMVRDLFLRKSQSRINMILKKLMLPFVPYLIPKYLPSKLKGLNYLRLERLQEDLNNVVIPFELRKLTKS